MTTFKYTVANTEGKKLTGTVEAPDRESARAELNNLGFSILNLKETTEEQPESTASKFAFEAVDKNAKRITGTVPAETEETAYKKLQEEYSLTVSALWPEKATPEQIEEAKNKGVQHLLTEVPQEEPKKEQTQKIEGSPQKEKETSVQQRKKEIESRAKIEKVIEEVNKLLQTYDKQLDATQKSEIKKRIDKLLRIKNSTNLEYIFVTAKDLLQYIKAQSEKKEGPGSEDEKLKLRMKTNKLIDSLLKSDKKSLSESVLEKIDKWEKEHKDQNIISSLLERIKEVFTTPEEIKPLKEKIKTLNKQLIEFTKMYFKEPSPEYKEKVKENLRNTWLTRKNTKKELKHMKKRIKEQRRSERIEEELYISFLEEVNSFTGWLLAFYIIYYFTALYLNTKDFGLTYIPGGFEVYASRFFKYILVIIFLLHSVTAMKVNFFRKTVIAEIILVPAFILGSIIAVLNF